MKIMLTFCIIVALGVAAIALSGAGVILSLMVGR